MTGIASAKSAKKIALRVHICGPEFSPLEEFPTVVLISFFSVCSELSAATLWQNQKRCEELADHLQTCSQGSRLWCVIWIGCLHKCTVGCQCNLTGRDWLHSTQCQSRNGWEDTTDVNIKHIFLCKQSVLNWKKSHNLPQFVCVIVKPINT